MQQTVLILVQLAEHLQAYYNKWHHNINEKNSVPQSVTKIKAIEWKKPKPRMLNGCASHIMQLNPRPPQGASGAATMSPCCLCPINTHPSYRDAG
jgi:hypothetical protein